MVNLCSLLVKYNNFSKVDDDIFVYIDRILENASEIHKRKKDAEKELACLEETIAQKQKHLLTSNVRDIRSPIKKRKVHSLDSSLTACKENVSILEDSTIFPHKSDSDVSSKLEQNILDSEEPFFVLTQTPPSPAVSPLREIVSPRNEPSTKPAIVSAAKCLFAEEIKSPKNIIRASRFGKHFKALESSPLAEEKPAAPTTATVTPNGKWTGKKCKGKVDSPNTEVTPAGLKRFHSLAESNSRFRQAKLNFVRQPKHSPQNEKDHAVNDTLFSDFVVPTPPSVANKSKFLRSLRMKKQSTMVSKGQSDTAVAKERTDATTSSTTAGEESSNPPAALQDDENFDDINQTYCPGVESINRITKDVPITIKQEPESQREKRRPFNFSATKPSDCATGLQQQPTDHTDSETDEVILLPSASLQSIVSVVESQHEHEKFVSELNDEKAKRLNEGACLGIDHAWSNNVQRNQIEFDGAPGEIVPFNRSFDKLREGLCNDCMKLYKFHTARGVSNDTARSKLPRNCRSCRVAQLHSTPPGFWDPDFLPTPE